MPLLGLLIALHALAAVVWVGGMFYAYMAMRPAVVQTLDPRLRPRLWVMTLRRFFLWVWISVATLLVTGYAMVFGWYGGMGNVGLHVHIMQGIGILMVLLFFHVFFAPYRRLIRAVADHDEASAARSIGQIRLFVGINLVLGLIVVAVAAGGRYLF